MKATYNKINSLTQLLVLQFKEQASIITLFAWYGKRGDNRKIVELSP